jgi:protein arginine N-methyltransferase 1
MNNPRHPHPQFRSIDVWRRLTSRVRAWCHAVARRFRRPPAGAAGADARYRAYNGWYFAQLGEQERMLADKPRMAFYHAAIARHVQPGDRVIDLGTGTGILAAFAARRGAAKVYAIDHSAILKHARTLAAHNRVRNIDFIATHSQDFRLDERVDVIVHEQMGDWLFDEAMVANVTDLRDRLLKPGGRILPSRFELYCEPVKLRDRSQVPFIWELEVHGYDYSCLERSRPQEPGYYHLRGGEGGLVEHFLGEPAPVLTLDLQTLREPELPARLSFSRTVRKAGRLDGLAVFFRVRLDDDLTLSSNPLDPGRAPHWGFRVLRTERADFAAGDVIAITLAAKRWSDPDSWRWTQERLRAESGGRDEPAAAAQPGHP